MRPRETLRKFKGTLLSQLVALSIFSTVPALASAFSIAATGGLGALDKRLDGVRAELPGQAGDQLKADLLFLATLRGSRASRLSDRDFGTRGRFDGESYLSFLLRHVDIVKFGPCNEGSFSCADVATPKQIWITPSYFGLSRVERVSYLIHEARHLDGARFMHAPCPMPFLDDAGQEIHTRSAAGLYLANLAACDYDETGPYGFQLVFLKNVATNCATCSKEDRGSASSLFDWLLYRILSPASKAKLRL